MRLYSTRDSVLEREVSFLAVIETFLAVSLTVLLVSHGYWKHFWVIVLVTPLLLLRTERSQLLGLQIFALEYNWLLGLPALIAVILVFPFLTLGALAAKLMSTARSLVANPIASFAAVPRNWFVQILCIDCFYPPELVPGIESTSDAVFDDLRLSRLRETLSKLENWRATCLFIPTVLPSYALAFAYRMTLKGTFIVWAPLLWIVPKFQPTEPVLVRLKQINKSSRGRVAVVFSVIFITAFLTKLLLYNGVIALSAVPNATLQHLILDYIAPISLPWWQLASLLNSVLAIALYFWSSDQLIRLQGQAQHEATTRVDYTIRWVSVIRAVLTIYTSACLAYLTVVRSRIIHLPPLDERLFPWQ